MSLHFHGTPITPQARLLELAGRNFCVSYAAPAQVEICHRIGQSVLLDNGAFSAWRSGIETTAEWWQDYYAWCEPWLDHQTTWAVIPDVIDGDEWENDALLTDWPFGDRGAPVWHMHETLERLIRLARRYPRLCIGSSGQYATVGSPSWHRRMEDAMNALCGSGPAPVWLHMLRGMAMVDAGYPFASVDSTDIAQNHHREQNTPRKMAERWDSIQSVPRWVPRHQLSLEAV